MEKVILVTDLTKQYECRRGGFASTLLPVPVGRKVTVTAVDSIRFSVSEGELLGFIGPNGAGKTTTLKCLSGLLRPTSGSVEVLGFIPFERKREFLRQISLVTGQKNQLWWDLPVSESFKLIKEIYGVTDLQYRTVLAELVEILDLQRLFGMQVNKLSSGERMRCEVAAGFIHSPRVLFLDEPTAGLDVSMQKKLRDFFRYCNEKRTVTILLTSHNMDDVLDLCKRVILIDNGVIVYDGSLDSLVRKMIHVKYIYLRFSKAVTRSDLQAYGDIVSLSPDSATISVARKRVPSVSGKVLGNLPVSDIDIREMDTADVIRLVFDRGERSGKLHQP